MERNKVSKIAALLGIALWYSTVAFGVGIEHFLLPLGPFLLFWQLLPPTMTRKKHVCIALGLSVVVSFLGMLLQEIFHSGSTMGFLSAIVWETLPLFVVARIVAIWQNVPMYPWMKAAKFMLIATVVGLVGEDILISDAKNSFELSQMGVTFASEWRKTPLSHLVVMPLVNIIYWWIALKYCGQLPVAVEESVTGSKNEPPQT